ncbi:PH domain-containing protein [Saccharomonospora sp. NPDC006951]
MDNSPLTWAPRVGLVAVGWLLAVAAGTSATFIALSADRPGAVLLAVATIALAAAALHGTVIRPRLAASTSGLRVRTVGGTRALAWGEVQLRLVTSKRMGRDVTVLEVEADDLVVLGWLELGTDPRDVHEELVALRAG